MRIPNVKGIIDRRILVNFRVDRHVLSDLLPSPFRPQLVGDYGTAELRSVVPATDERIYRGTFTRGEHQLAVSPRLIITSWKLRPRWYLTDPVGGTTTPNRAWRVRRSTVQFATRRHTRRARHLTFRGVRACPTPFRPPELPVALLAPASS
jgi:hypothetical protein